MKHFTAILFFILSCSSLSPAQERLSRLYQFGAWFDDGGSCINRVNTNYGFRTVSGGCSPLSADLRRNEKSLIKLEKRNGKGWQEKYRSELFKCASNTNDSARAEFFYWISLGSPPG